MYTYNIPLVADGKLYQLRCARHIKKVLKKYKKTYLVIEKIHEPDEWKVFSVWNYLKMNFRKDEIMVIYVYGKERTEEEELLNEVCRCIYENLSKFN